MVNRTTNQVPMNRMNERIVPSYFANTMHAPDLSTNNMVYEMREIEKESKIPRVNILESEKHFSIEMAVPGLKKEDFTLLVMNDTLNISVNAKITSAEEENVHCVEFSYHSFSRCFQLMDEIAVDEISACYEKGILHMMLPKIKKTSAGKPKDIKIR
jgi:HSP20 family protein